MRPWEIVGMIFILLSCFIIAVNLLTFNFVGICLGIFSLGMWLMIINGDRKKERIEQQLAEEFKKRSKKNVKQTK